MSILTVVSDLIQIAAGGITIVLVVMRVVRAAGRGTRQR